MCVLVFRIRIARMDDAFMPVARQRSPMLMAEVPEIKELPPRLGDARRQDR